MAPETVTYAALDGVLLEADITRCDASRPRGTLVIGHPHPLHGGDRRNHVVRALQAAALRLSFHSISPDFRGTGGSSGEHDEGNSERLDLDAACELAELIAPDSPVVMSGYSFGAMVALDVTHPLIAGWVAIAPPLRARRSAPSAALDPRPKVIVAPEHDQFTTPAEARAATGLWSRTDVMLATGVDHFLTADAGHWCSAALSMVCEAAGLSGD